MLTAPENRYRFRLLSNAGATITNLLRAVLGQAVEL
jgi:hypothetical protein